MNKIILSCLFTLNLAYAVSFVDIYRNNGIEAVEIQIEETLQNPLYWQEFLKNKDIQKGYYEFDTPIVFVDKKAKSMQLYHNINYKQTEKSSQEVIVGKMGDKQKEGDLKTPVGVYDITKRFIPQDGFYGPVSFELSYPNVMDKLNKKNGDGIWIHGFPLNNEKREGRTRGCVAVENDILIKFDQDLGVDKAIVIISENGDITTDKNTIANLLANLYRWRYAWKISDTENYLKFYDDSFKRFDGQDIKQFSSMKKQIFNKSEKKIINFKNIGISPYPNLENKNLYRIVFHEDYKTKTYKFTGKKELYVLFKDNTMKIVTEK